MNITELSLRTTRFFYLSTTGLRGNDQERIYVVARQFFFSVARNMDFNGRNHTLEYIGKFVNRSHSTVIHCLEMHKNELNNARYFNDYKRYCEYLGIKQTDLPIDVSSIITERDKLWKEGIEKQYGKMLNSTLLKKIEPKQ